METAIAQKLEPILNQDSDFYHWENTSLSWQQKAKQTIISEQSPHYLIEPYHVQTLTEIIKYAYKNRLTILPCGNGSKLNWGGLVSKADLVVSSKKLNQIVDYAVSDLTITVESGVKLSQLQQILHKNQQFLPIDPSYPESATMGGIVATADTGSWRQRYGSVRDLIIGISFIRADGEIAKAGGKVVKNVAGYDLMKLFTGSYGTLGFISQVTFRVYPLPEASSTLILVGEPQKIQAITQQLVVSALTPTAVDLLSPTLVNYLQLGEGIGLAIRFQSISQSVEVQINKIIIVAQEIGLSTQEYQSEVETDLWQRLNQAFTSQNGAICKIGLLPSVALDFLYDCSDFALIHASSGLGKLMISAPDNQSASPDQKFNLIRSLRKMRSLCEDKQGFLTILEAPKTLKQNLEPWGYQGNALGIMNKLKQQFDPQNIFSPHRFINQ